MNTDPSEIVRLLEASRAGDRPAMDRALAHRQLASRRRDQTLDTTALVHEAYLKLVHRSPVTPADRRHLLALAARAMRQIIVDYARRNRAARRGGGAGRIPLENEAASGRPGLCLDDHTSEILAIDDALTRLRALDPRLGQVVELRFFAGFPVEETGEVLGVSVRTVKRLWRTARAVLYEQLRES
jgi:RNA polymerase sigma factor (TIGR02999 family)